MRCAPAWGLSRTQTYDLRGATRAMTTATRASRKAIVDAAFTLFAERGDRKVDVSEICRRAGVSRATFYLHFRNRDEIIAYGMRELMGNFWIKIGADDAKNDVIATVQHCLAELVVSSFHGATVRDILELCAHSSVVRNEYTALMAETRKRIRDQLVLGQRDGTVRRDLDALHLASLLVGAAYGAIFTIEIGAGGPGAPGFDSAGLAKTVTQLLRAPEQPALPR
jgi:AcrR family transcriptional regulator